MRSFGEGVMEEFLIISGLVGVQIILAVYVLFLKRILAVGVNSLFLVVSGSFVSALFLLPFAVVLETKKWPKRWRPVLMVAIVLVAVLGVAFQALTLLGIKATSPGLASAMPNLAPGFIFIIAVCRGFEKFSIWCTYSRAKVLGTMVCLSGAIIMSFLMSPSVEPDPDSTTTPGSSSESANLQWILGCFYLLAGVIVVSCAVVLQATVMLEFPAPFSLCVVTAFMSSFMTALLQFIMEGKLDVGSTSLSFANIIAFVLVGTTITSSCVVFQTWCINKKGPVLVSVFSPIQTISSAILSARVLGQVITLGSLIGMLLMFVGLYVVLWAKKKEASELQGADDNERQSIPDTEQPLLA